jgi:hypothetical protein
MRGQKCYACSGTYVKNNVCATRELAAFALALGTEINSGWPAPSIPLQPQLTYLCCQLLSQLVELAIGQVLETGEVNEHRRILPFQ